MVYICSCSGSTFLLYLSGRELLTNKYMSKHEYMSLSETYLNNQTQTGLCPHKVENCCNSSIYVEIMNTFTD